MSCCNQLVVGIFSREDYSSYDWLTNCVRSVTGVKDVRSVQITNTWSHFTGQVPKCSFAILYHSKRRGRINISDVTDSLYDKELKHLSDVYGKDRVLVVIDDLTDTSEKEKSRILQLQPSIETLASNLFLYKEGYGDSDERTPLMSPRNTKLETLIRSAAIKAIVYRCVIWLIFSGVVLLIVIVVVSTVRSGHSEYQNVTSEPTPTITLSASSNTSENTTYPPGNATHPPGNSTHPSGNATHPQGNSTHPPGNSTHPPGNATHPPGNSTHPPENSTHPPGNATHPPGNSTHPPENNTHPPRNATHPLGNSTHPPENSTHPPGNATHPPGNSTHPLGNATHPLGNSIHPQGNATHPPGNSTHSPGNATHPPGNSTHLLVFANLTWQEIAFTYRKSPSICQKNDTSLMGNTTSQAGNTNGP